MKQKEIIFILLSGFALVLFLMIFNIYHNSVTSTIPPALGTQIIPIKPSFTESTFTRLKERKKIEPIMEAQLQIKASEAATVENNLESSPSSELNEENFEE